MTSIHGQLAAGRKIRVLTVVDTFSRYAPVIDPRFSYRGEDVVVTLERSCAVLGYPEAIRVDQGSEFVSRDLDLWAYAKGVTLDFSRPGTPTTRLDPRPPNLNPWTFRRTGRRAQGLDWIIARQAPTSVPADTCSPAADPNPRRSFRVVSNDLGATVGAFSARRQPIWCR